MAWLISTTSPASGAKTSDAAFTEFDDGCAVALRQLGADIGQLDKDEISELGRSMRRDADGRHISVELQPFVLLGESQQGLLLI